MRSLVKTIDSKEEAKEDLTSFAFISRISHNQRLNIYDVREGQDAGLLRGALLKTVQLTGISLLGCCHGVRRVLPFQCSLAGTPLWCVVSGLTVVCAWDIEPVSLFGCPPDYLN